MQVTNKTKMFVLIIMSLMIISCASPAHENTVYLGHDTRSVFVTVHSLDNYEIDGYLVDSKGLAIQIKSLSISHSLKSMIIDASSTASLFDQALAVYIGEKNNLQTYRKTLFGSEEISSKAILAEIDKSKEEGFSIGDLWDNINNSI